MSGRERICRYLYKYLGDRRIRTTCRYYFYEENALKKEPSGVIHHDGSRPICKAAERCLREQQYRTKMEAPLTKEQIMESIGNRQQEMCDSYVQTPEYKSIKKTKLNREVAQSVSAQEVIISPGAIAEIPQQKKKKGRKTKQSQESDNMPQRNEMFGALLRGEITPQEIAVGVSVTGIETIDDLDLLNNELLKASSGQTGISKVRKSKQVKDYVLPDLRKRGFNGSVSGIEAAVIANRLEKESSITDEQDLFEYLAKVGLFSTGRGKVAEMLLDVKVYRKENAHSKSYLGVSVKNLTGEEGLIELEDLFIMSGIGWAESQREALRNVISGGLPSLGKRR